MKKSYVQAARIFTTLAVMGSLLSPVEANFASDPNRTRPREFAKFFIARFNTWYTKEVLHLELNLKPTEKAYWDEFVATATLLGKETPNGFLRAFDYGVRLENGKEENGPQRFFDLENRQPLRAKAIAAIKAQAPSFDLKKLEGFDLGLGFHRPGVDFEILIWQPDLLKSLFLKDQTKILSALATKPSAGRLTLGIKNSKIARVEVLVPKVEREKSCPACSHISQSDLIISQDGTKHSSDHLDQYEEMALDPAGRSVGNKFRTNFNLIPGTIEWVSYKDYSFTYP